MSFLPGLIRTFFNNLFLNNKTTRQDRIEPLHYKGIKITSGDLLTCDNVRIGYYMASPIDFITTRYILILHGAGDNRKSFFLSNHLELLVKKGFSLVIPDYRGFGDSEGTFSVEGGNYDIDTSIEFIKSIIKKENSKKNSKIFMLGYSLGASLALEYVRCLNERNICLTDKLSKIILMAPFLNTSEIISEKTKIWKIFKKYFKDASFLIEKDLNYENDKNIKLVKNDKIIIFHGREDDLIPCAHSETLAKICGCKFIKLNYCTHYNLFCNFVFDEIDKFFR